MLEADFHEGGDQAIVRFTFELSQLREETRHGWLRIHENPESVAEHTQRAAALGYFLACREGFADPNLVVTRDAHALGAGSPTSPTSSRARGRRPAFSSVLREPTLPVSQRAAGFLPAA